MFGEKIGEGDSQPGPETDKGAAGGGGAFGVLTEVKRYWWLLKKLP